MIILKVVFSSGNPSSLTEHKVFPAQGVYTILHKVFYVDLAWCE